MRLKAPCQLAESFLQTTNIVVPQTAKLFSSFLLMACIGIKEEMARTLILINFDWNVFLNDGERFTMGMLFRAPQQYRPALNQRTEKLL